MTSSAMEWVNPERFSQWVGHGISSELVQRMLSNQHLTVRCGELVRGRLGLPTPSALQVVALSLDTTGLTRLAHHAGAIWHAASVARLIDGSAVRDLIAAIEPQLRLFAIRNNALAPPIIDDLAPDALPEDIVRSGQRCLAAWCAAQPASVGVRIVLRLASDLAPHHSHREFGPALVDSLLTRNDELTP
jgi:hypothetical protein